MSDNSPISCKLSSLSCGLCGLKLYPIRDNDDILLSVWDGNANFKHRSCQIEVDDINLSTINDLITMVEPIDIQENWVKAALQQYASSPGVMNTYKSIGHNFGGLVSYFHNNATRFDCSHFALFFNKTHMTQLPMTLPLLGILTRLTTYRVVVDVTQGTKEFTVGAVLRDLNHVCIGSVHTTRDTGIASNMQTIRTVFVAETRHSRERPVGPGRVLRKVEADVVILSQPHPTVGPVLVQNAISGPHSNISDVITGENIQLRRYCQAQENWNQKCMLNIETSMKQRGHTAIHTHVVTCNTASSFKSVPGDRERGVYYNNITPNVDVMADGVYVCTTGDSFENPMLYEYSGLFGYKPPHPVVLVCKNAVEAHSVAQTKYNKSCNFKSVKRQTVTARQAVTDRTLSTARPTLFGQPGLSGFNH